MEQDFNFYSCFLACMLLATVVNAQQGDPGSSAKIRTERLSIDFGTVRYLESIQNAVQTEEGVRPEGTGRNAILLSDEITVPVDSVAPFLAVGSRWAVTPSKDVRERVRFELRFSADRRQWSEWKTVALDDHLTVRSDTLVGTLQYLPQDTRFIQFQVTISATDRDAEELQLRSVLLSFTSPGSTSPELLQSLDAEKTKPDRQKGEAKQQGQPGAYPTPEYISRTGWGCPDGQEPSGPVSVTNVTHQIVHHSAGPNTSTDWPAVVRSIWDYHVNTNNWSDIGYNWLIDPNGIIYQGRGWVDGDDEVQGAHFCGTNSNTMGACLLGNFEEAVPSSNAQHALVDLLAWKSDQKNIDPVARRFHFSSGLNLYTISAHRDGCSTLCPGENLYIRLPEIRENVNTLITDPVVATDDISSVGNYPNPFSGTTTITFTLERAGEVRITVWDITGRLVQVVADKFYEAESHTETWNASGVASGTYFCQIEFEQQAAVQQMVLMR